LTRRRADLHAAPCDLHAVARVTNAPSSRAKAPFTRRTHPYALSRSCDASSVTHMHTGTWISLSPSPERRRPLPLCSLCCRCAYARCILSTSPRTLFRRPSDGAFDGRDNGIDGLASRLTKYENAGDVTSRSVPHARVRAVTRACASLLAFPCTGDP